MLPRTEAEAEVEAEVEKAEAEAEEADDWRAVLAGGERVRSAVTVKRTSAAAPFVCATGGCGGGGSPATGTSKEE